MEITLTAQQQHVDNMIDVRINRISAAAYRAANMKVNGRARKVHVPYTLPMEVTELLNLRQALYAGADPESIAALVTSGQIQHTYLDSK